MTTVIKNGGPQTRFFVLFEDAFRTKFLYEVAMEIRNP